MKAIWDKFVDELMTLLPVTAFFLITAQLLAVTESLMLRQYEINVSVFLTSALVALVVAKVVVIVDQLAPLESSTALPLAVNAGWKTCVYFLAVSAARYAEDWFHVWHRTGDAAGAHQLLVSDIVWPHFWVVQLWLLVLLFFFCAYRELDRALGTGRLVRVFFRRPIRARFEASGP
jgi:hypothetical protein